MFSGYRTVFPCLFAVFFWLGASLLPAALVPVVVSTNVTVRVMAANLSSGGNQRYESPGLNILKGLKPDIVALQEFNYVSTNGGTENTAAALREMVNATFGTNFSYYREPGSYNIPNGIISRYRILSSNSWDDVDTGITDRGFAWAQIDLPGTNDLYVVSVHLKASSGASNEVRRAAEALQLKSLIQSNFPANAWVMVAGDFNIFNDSEAVHANLSTFLSDQPLPADQNGDPDTNQGRDERYDRIYASFTLTNRIVPVVMPTRTYNNGLVFVSSVYTPLSEVTPVVFTDSGATGMQHMGVVKALSIPTTVTNFIDVPPPQLRLTATNVLRWGGVSNLTYSIQFSTNLTQWTNLGTATAVSTNFAFTNNSPLPRRFFRVTYP